MPKQTIKPFRPVYPSPAALITSVAPDAVAARYRSETSRFLTALAILLGVMGYLATQILALGDERPGGTVLVQFNTQVFPLTQVDS